MNGEQISKYVKAGAAILTAVAGITIGEGDVNLITSAFLILYGIVSAVQGKIFKAKK